MKGQGRILSLNFALSLSLYPSHLITYHRLNHLIIFCAFADAGSLSTHNASSAKDHGKSSHHKHKHKEKHKHKHKKEKKVKDMLPCVKKDVEGIYRFPHISLSVTMLQYTVISWIHGNSQIIVPQESRRSGKLLPEAEGRGQQFSRSSRLLRDNGLTVSK